MKFVRFIFHAASGLSLFLLLLTLSLWLRSSFYRDLWTFGQINGNTHTIQSIKGRLHWLTNLDGGSTGGLFYRPDRLSPDAIWNGAMSGYPVKVEWHLGFIFQTYARYFFLGLGGSPGITTHQRLIVIPYWALALLFSLLPTLWLLHHRRRPFGPGQCRSCGYDLRATPDRCPECGQTPHPLSMSIA